MPKTSNMSTSDLSDIKMPGLQHNKSLFTRSSMMIVVPAGQGLLRPEQHSRPSASSTAPHSASPQQQQQQHKQKNAEMHEAQSSLPMLSQAGQQQSPNSMAATPDTSGSGGYYRGHGSSASGYAPLGPSGSNYSQQGLASIGSRGGDSPGIGMGPIPEDPPDASSHFKYYKSHSAPALPLSTPLPSRVRRRRYPHASAAMDAVLDPKQPVPKPEQLDKYEGPYHIICKRLLGQAPAEIREELSKVVAVVLDRCNDLEDRMMENEKRACDLSRAKLALTQKVQQLTKLLANSKSSLKAAGSKAKELEGEVMFRTTVMNKQVESINKLSGKNLKLASALHKLHVADEQLGNGSNGSHSDGVSSPMGQTLSTTTTRFVMSETGRANNYNNGYGQTGRRMDDRDEGMQAFNVKKEIIMTVRSVTKENLELVTKTRILDEDNRNFKEQLRVVNEKLRAIYAHLDEYGSRSDAKTLQQLAEEALAQDPENHIKMATIQSRKVSILELLEGEEDRLGKIINNPAVDSVITLIQFRDLVKLISVMSSAGNNSDDVLRELLSRAACRLLGCESLVLHVLDKDETMWSMSMSNVSRRAYHSTSKGIAGLTLRTGHRVNTSTPREHPHFDAQVDGFSTLVPRNLLAIPLRDHEGRCVAVLEALNKAGPSPPLSTPQQNVACSPCGVNPCAAAFDSVDELLGELLLAQAYILLTNSKVSTVTEWKFETCLKFLTMPANYLKSLVLDVLYPTTTLANNNPDRSLLWAMKKMQHMVEEVLRAKHVRLFILDSVDHTLCTVADTIDPVTCQKVKVKRTFAADQGFAGHMAHSSGKMVIRSPQSDPRVNSEVDLDSGTQALHCCTVQALSGQVIAVVQVAGSSFDALNERGGAGGPRHHSIASLSLLDALDIVCEQLAPYLETILQVISPHFLFSELQPRPTVRCAVLDQANELEALRTQVAVLTREVEATGGDRSKAAAREREREALQKKVVELEAGREALGTQVTLLTSQLQASVGERDRLTSQLQATVGEGDRHAAELGTQLQEAQAKNAALAASLAKAGEATQALQQEVDRLKTEGQKKPLPPPTAKPRTSDNVQMSDAKPTTSDPKVEAGAPNNKANDAEERAKLQAGMEGMRRQLDDTNRRLEEVTSQRDQATSDLAKASQEAQTLRAQQALLSSAQAEEMAALRKRNGELEASVVEMEGSGVREREEGEALRAQVASLGAALAARGGEGEEEVVQLRRELREKGEEAEALRLKAEEAGSEVNDLRTQVAYLREQLATYSAQYYQQADAAVMGSGGGGVSEWDPYSDEQGNVYYVNRLTGETSWEKPSDEGGVEGRRPGVVGYEDDGFSPEEGDRTRLTALHTADFVRVEGGLSLEAEEGGYPEVGGEGGAAEMAGSPKSRYRIDL